VIPRLRDRPPHVGPIREHGLDLLRAAAILMVVSFHSIDLSGVRPTVRHAFAFGWMGVDLFFVLSGFLIGRQAFKARDQSPSRFLETFWTKRWLRTLPLYYVVLFTYAVIKPAVFHAPFNGSIWHFVSFTQNYAAPRDFVASWSLCVEEQFYLLFPLVVIVTTGRRTMPPWGWLVPLAGSAVLRMFVFGAIAASAEAPAHAYFDDQIHWPTHTHLDGLCVGLFLASTEPIWQVWPGSYKRGIAAAGLLLWLATCAGFGATPGRNVWTAVLTYPLISAAFGLLLVGVRSLALPRLFHRSIESIALWSYGAYLWHGLVLRAVDRSSGRLGSWPVQATCFLVGTFAAACVTYYVVEKPSLDFRDRLLAARRSRLRDARPSLETRTDGESYASVGDGKGAAPDNRERKAGC
jgi:peptidoglycan/LPS O-acetylase OafA/YrhL